jgi:hypothetical protein
MGFINELISTSLSAPSAGTTLAICAAAAASTRTPSGFGSAGPCRKQTPSPARNEARPASLPPSLSKGGRNKNPGQTSASFFFWRRAERRRRRTRHPKEHTGGYAGTGNRRRYDSPRRLLQATAAEIGHLKAAITRHTQSIIMPPFRHPGSYFSPFAKRADSLFSAMVEGRGHGESQFAVRRGAGHCGVARTGASHAARGGSGG